MLLGRPRLGDSPSSVLVSLVRDECRQETTRIVETREQDYLRNILEHKVASGRPASLSAPTIGILGIYACSQLLGFPLLLPSPDLRICIQFQRLCFSDSGNQTYRISRASSSWAVMDLLVIFGTPDNLVIVQGPVPELSLARASCSVWVPDYV